jgi:hypothetical protein
VFAELEKANDYKISRSYSAAASHRIIKSNWHAEKMQSHDLKCFATIAILSGATPDQPMMCEDFLIDAMLARRARDGHNEPIPEDDVREIILDLYSKADGVGSEWPETKVNKAIDHGKGKKEAYGKARKEQAKAGLEDTEDTDIIAGSSKDMDELAGNIGKARVPDDRVSDSSNDEDEVLPPSRRRV